MLSTPLFATRSIHAADREEQVRPSPRHQFIGFVDRHFGLTQSPGNSLHCLFGSADYKQLRCRMAHQALAQLLGVDLDPAQDMIDVRIQHPCPPEPEREPNCIPTGLSYDRLANRVIGHKSTKLALEHSSDLRRLCLCQANCHPREKSLQRRRSLHKRRTKPSLDIVQIVARTIPSAMPILPNDRRY